MNYKYYDLLSNLTVGVVAVYTLWKILIPELDISEWVVIPAGYVVGYFLDAFSSLIEPVLYRTIGGKPSNVLLTPIEGQEWTGIKKVKFFFSKQVVEELKHEIGDNATTDKMFSYVMRIVNTNTDCRIPDFRSHYALSRVILTVTAIAVTIAEIKYYYIWYSWGLSAIILYLAWNRFRERGYYYAREVLNEYLKLRRS